jgi:hypothetical protein
LERHWDREIHKPQTRNVSKARALGATLEALFLIAAFCRLAKLLNYSKQMGWLVGTVGIELLFNFTSPALSRCYPPPAKSNNQLELNGAN